MPTSRDGRSQPSKTPSVSDTQIPDSTIPSSTQDQWQNSPSAEDATSPLATTATAAFLRQRIVLTNSQKIWAKRYRTEISASTASLASTLTAYPLDSVKTRMQAYRFPSFLHCVRHTYRTEGIHGFWRGVIAPLASITIVRTVSFSIYQKAKYTYDEWITHATGHSPLLHANTTGALPSLSTVTCFGAAGATSGALITAISCPFELTKLNAQISVLMANATGVEKPSTAPTTEKTEAKPQQPQPSKKSMGTMGTVKTIVKHRGVRGLYSGFHLHLLRDTIGTAIYFMTYESAKQMLANARGNSPTSPLAVVVAGGLCGLVSWACIYPIDSAKSIYQRNILSSGSETAKKSRIQFFNKRMYRGLGVSMGRSCLINAIFFSVFELVKKQVNRLEVDEDD